ncbi:MAG: hypothetical protein Q8R87_00550 [Anaerolineaceae bacterium]|nr:hypothetical protein [Anaerolineaceae bacterium]
MMKKLRWTSVILIFALLVALVPQTVKAQSSDSVFVSETGHWIWGDFLRTYNSVSDPLLYFGYPITDDFIDPQTNQRVQYFQRARFDLVDTPEGPMVQIAPLGKLLHAEGAELADIPREGPTCRSFNTGFTVCYAFLQFYDSYNGSTWFGLPISEVEVVDGHYVQYFENIRMEWWPDKPNGERVVISDLGRIYFDKEVRNPELLKSSQTASIASTLINPVVNVFALNSLVGAGEPQTIFVIVQNQNLLPVVNAQVGVTLYYPDGSKQFYRLAETNEFGISQFSFQVDQLEVRTVVNAIAEINVRGESASGKTWFRIWW